MLGKSLKLLPRAPGWFQGLSIAVTNEGFSSPTSIWQPRIRFWTAFTSRTCRAEPNGWRSFALPVFNYLVGLVFL